MQPSFFIHTKLPWLLRAGCDSTLAKDNQNVGMTERIISGIAAVALGAWAVKKKDTLLGKGLTGVSGFLLTRATTGFCPLNKAIGRKLSQADR